MNHIRSFAELISIFIFAINLYYISHFSDMRLLPYIVTFDLDVIVMILTVVIMTFGHPQKLAMDRMNHTSKESMELMNCWHIG